MIVLLDSECLKGPQKQLTQLSAIRVDCNWSIVSRYDALICPMPDITPDYTIIAYGGYEPDQFERGIDTPECIRQFSEWLEDSDRLWTWSMKDRNLIWNLWRLTLSDPVPSVRYKSHRSCAIAKSEGINAITPYEILKKVGIAAPVPEHRSANDVEAMRLLFKYQDIVNWEPKKKEGRSPSQIRKRNAKIIGRSSYNYLYVPGSDVFHRRDCKLVLGAKVIWGSRFFTTAASSHRPCKVCRPVAGLNFTPEIKVPEQKPNYKPLLPVDNQIVPAKTVDGRNIWICKNNILGWCNYDLHRGAVTKPILQQHDCIGKGCYHFQRNDKSTYWAVQKKKQERKDYIRGLNQEKKQRASFIEDDLRRKQSEWQSILDDLGSDMLIVRLEAESQCKYTVFYVSDNPFPDGNCFPEFLGHVRRHHPNIYVKLRHIKDWNGRFVTRDEYHARFKK